MQFVTSNMSESRSPEFLDLQDVFESENGAFRVPLIPYCHAFEQNGNSCLLNFATPKGRDRSLMALLILAQMPQILKSLFRLITNFYGRKRECCKHDILVIKLYLG